MILYVSKTVITIFLVHIVLPDVATDYESIKDALPHYECIDDEAYYECITGDDTFSNDTYEDIDSFYCTDINSNPIYSIVRM